MQHNKIISMFLIFLISSLSVHAVETATYDLSYDQNGNVVRGLGLYHEYDELNRLVRVLDGGPTGQLVESYTYDDGNTRLTKTNHIENETTYYISDEFIEVRNATGTYLTVYAYDGNTLVGRKDPNGARFFYHPDHLGSADLVTDESQNIVEETTYKPFGGLVSGGQESDFLYTGKEKDSTGLMYYGARYYDPFPGRFTQPDQNIPDLYNPQSFNRYAYVLNNPYKYVDPTGESPLLVIAGVAGLIGGGISAYITYQQTGSWQKAAISGAIGFAGTAASVGLIGITGTTAVAGGALRVAAPTLAEKGLTAAGLATIGAGQSVAEQTLVQGRSYSQLSGTDIAISAGANVLLPSFFEKVPTPGIIQRTPGQFFPSTYSPALGSEIRSQSIETLYSETTTRGAQSIANNIKNGPQASQQNSQNQVSQTQTSRSNAFTRFFNRIRSRFKGNK